jgi:hypothetical protein
MKAILEIRSALLILVILVAGAGCVVHDQPVYTTAPGPYAVASGEVVVAGPPPPPIQETVVASPGAGFVWIGGSWGWGGNRWNWEHGHWAKPPHSGAVWVPHRYYNREGRHVWVRGGWH